MRLVYWAINLIYQTKKDKAIFFNGIKVQCLIVYSICDFRTRHPMACLYAFRIYIFALKNLYFTVMSRIACGTWMSVAKIIFVGLNICPKLLIKFQTSNKTNIVLLVNLIDSNTFYW